MRRTLPSPPLLALSLLLAGAAPARAQLTVTPAALQLAAVDTAASSVVRVRNEGSAEMQVRFYTEDFEQALSGDYAFQGLGTHPRSCAGRLSVYPDGALLRPGEEQVVRVRMAPGAETCWSMLFAETQARSEGPIRIAERAAIKVFGVAPSQAPEGEVAAVVPARDARGLHVTVEFSNTGALPVNPDGTLEVRALDGRVVRSVEVPRFSVLPGHRRQVTVEVGEPLPSGRYLLVPVLDFGAEYLAGGQVPLSVP